MKNHEPVDIITHDIRGQICPSSLLFALQEVNAQRAKIKEGSIQLLIQTDNRDATTTIPDAVVSMGYECSVDKKEGYYEIKIMAPTKPSRTE